jgi:hypothetical protein
MHHSQNLDGDEVKLRREIGVVPWPAAAAPEGSAALTATALYEHPTAAGLVAHMMQTWHPRPPAGSGVQRRATTITTAPSSSSPSGPGLQRSGSDASTSLGIEDDDAHDGAAPSCFGSCTTRRSKQSKRRHM